MLLGKTIIVVMPAYNAERTLRKTFDEIPHDIVDEIILVDDASSDNTSLLAKELHIHTVIRHDYNRGYGGNQKTCYDTALISKPDVVIMLHPDYQYSPKLIRPLASLIIEGGFDISLGSRMLGIGALQGGMPYYKYISNKFITWLENKLIGQNLSEYHTGYRAYSAKVLREIPYHKNSEDFIFDNEFLLQAHFLGFSIGEITCPTRYFPEASSISFLRSLKYGILCCFTAIKFRLNKMNILKSDIFQ